MGKSIVVLLLFTASSMAQVSPHGEIAMECQSCHGTDAWTMRPDAPFRHETVGFALTGKHNSLKCQSCHKDLTFARQQTGCAGCHADVHQGELGTTCARCHSSRSWLVPDMIRKHQDTRFPLLGGHATIGCESCHRRMAYHQYLGTPTTCIGCHAEDYQATLSPAHAPAGFSMNCQECHDQTALSWNRGFDHTITGFPLTGAHLQQACLACHADNVFAGKPSDCVACHLTAFTTATSPNHVAGGFPRQCQTCHTTTAWSPVTFSHAATQFPLTGEHARVACMECHGNGQYQGLSTACNSCHAGDFQSTTNPLHVAGGFPVECQTCHTTGGWSPSTFNHAATQFPLTGAHVAVVCGTCHLNGQYQGLSTACYDCHTSDFQSTTNPAHVAGNFSHTCQSCHTTAGWTPSTFSHANTPFPLTGAHISVACSGCHANGVFGGTPSACYDCHTSDFQSTTNPAHVAGNFPHTCQSCHTTAGWTPSTFSHANTAFPLTGAHISVACSGCHANGVFGGTPSACYDCHTGDFQSTTNPAHVAGNFSHTCQSCHTTAGWTPSTFNHANTPFPLVGAHMAVACSGCHANGVFGGTPSACFSCHGDEFQATTNPAHAAGGFSHDCTGCHSMTAWTPATFNHGTTAFPLTGAHVPLSCQSCHVGGNYQLTYVDCYQCHQTDYATPTNPNHVTLQLSHMCNECHTTTAWQPSTLNHDSRFFRIYSGRHRQEWTSCADCHQVPGNMTSFTCINCHEHNRTDTDRDHQGVSGYQYSSPSCYSCHRNV